MNRVTHFKIYTADPEAMQPFDKDVLPNLPDYARENFETGWTRLVGFKLKQFVERKDQ